MPYVEVWVDEPEVDQKALALVKELVAIAHEAAARQWPGGDATALERAALAVADAFDLPRHPRARCDEQYELWRRKRDIEGAQPC